MPDLSHETADDGFHEIQLNGKQLVFLFIVATLVSVAIFLCGVLVGRGARAARGEDPIEAAAQTQVPAPPPVPDSGPPSAEPPREIFPACLASGGDSLDGHGGRQCELRDLEGAYVAFHSSHGTGWLDGGLVRILLARAE